MSNTRCKDFNSRQIVINELGFRCAYAVNFVASNDK